MFGLFGKFLKSDALLTPKKKGYKNEKREGENRRRGRRRREKEGEGEGRREIKKRSPVDLPRPARLEKPSVS